MSRISDPTQVDKVDFRRTLASVLVGDFERKEVDQLFARFEVDRCGKINYKDFNRIIRKETLILTLTLALTLTLTLTLTLILTLTLTRSTTSPSRPSATPPTRASHPGTYISPNPNRNPYSNPNPNPNPNPERRSARPWRKAAEEFALAEGGAHLARYAGDAREI